MGNIRKVIKEIENLRERMIVYIGVLGIGRIIINEDVIILGMRKMDKVSKEIEDIREGR